ncbi:DUF2269 family protein [Pseudomaricurvus alkylphenolicus]|uniref:DUF2269 family protein n=1 Tax=Pseudomaricurvus alkylphenolicus TaxID=1306991 RepID=UPI00141EB64C|nr:DUF2269 family protein [Pseudomaricurvus alkylphenolicus]NIB38365.1 DUF2269 family protein [Pseudomaricurvus alkylphenolicus]
MAYQYLKFFHVLGAVLMGAGLIGVWISDLRSRQLRDDIIPFAEAIRNIALFYNGLTFPGALMMLVTGVWLVVEFYGGLEFIKVPWLAGMIFLFLFEFIEGNSITRVYFVKVGRITEQSLKAGQITPELKKVTAQHLPTFTHFLDLPILFLIIALAVLKPTDWTTFFYGSTLAIVTATFFSVYIPSKYPWNSDTATTAGV